jgi:hypothetical protein
MCHSHPSSACESCKTKSMYSNHHQPLQNRTQNGLDRVPHMCRTSSVMQGRTARTAVCKPRHDDGSCLGAQACKSCAAHAAAAKVNRLSCHYAKCMPDTRKRNQKPTNHARQPQTMQAQLQHFKAVPNSPAVQLGWSAVCIQGWVWQPDR